MIFYDFYETNQESTLPGAEKGVRTKTTPAVFPMGVQKEEIQQWRPARSRPGEMEAINIMLIEKGYMS